MNSRIIIAFFKSVVQTMMSMSMVWSSRMARKKAFEIIEMMMLKYGNKLSARRVIK